MTKFLLIRHGQSVANAAKIYSGHSHLPLSDIGWKQAQCTGAYLAAHYKIDRIYSSDLLRAVTTACAISEKLGMMPVYTDPGLREINAGDWEGLTYPELEKKFPEEIEHWYHAPWLCRCNGGESVEEVGHRLVKNLLKLAAENEEKTVVVATHAAAIRTTVSYALQGNFERMFIEIPNASVSEIDCDAQSKTFSLKSAGFAEHLSEVATPVF